MLAPDWRSAPGDEAVVLIFFQQRKQIWPIVGAPSQLYVNPFADGKVSDGVPGAKVDNVFSTLFQYVTGRKVVHG